MRLVNIKDLGNLGRGQLGWDGVDLPAPRSFRYMYAMTYSRYVIGRSEQ